MARQSLQLPVIQNWSCHNCGGCCREHLIEITDEEKRRIEKQGWSSDGGNSGDQPLILPLGRGRYRLAHQADGACVFLNEQGLCRIHAKFGEAAKPLACRVYPYAFHPAGTKALTVSLRFSCPSVVQNVGPPVSAQQAELQALAGEIVRGKQRDHDPPLIHRGGRHGSQQTTWADFHQFLGALDAALADTTVDFVVRLMRVLSWLELVAESQFTTIRGDKLTEYLQLISDAAVTAQPDNDLPIHRPQRIARVIFRLLAGQYARHDTEADYRRGWGLRMELLAAALKLTTGRGTVPVLPGSASVAVAFGSGSDGSAGSEQKPRAVRFAELERPFGGRQPEIDELFGRYFRVKLQGIHFCGPAYYDVSLVEGFQHLALMYPVVLWLARLRAAQRNNDHLNLTDVQAALATADHNFGYSPALGTTSALNRVGLLFRMKQMTALVGWYSQ
ncbi:MAG: YkgJ family cysteine cluster protein [Fuerstiella sp.]